MRSTSIATAVLAALVAGSVPVTASAVDDEPVARYDFDDPANRGLDSTGHGHDIDTRIGSPAFGVPAGRTSTALQLSGATNTYARIPDAVFGSVGDDFTMEFDLTSASSGNGFFTVGIGKDDHRYLLIKIDDNGGGRVAIATDQWRNEQGFSFSATPGWHTYRLTVQAGLLAMYVDDELAGYKDDVTIKMSDLQSTTAYLGRSFYANDRTFNGSFDDISIWDDAQAPVPVTSLAVKGDGVADGSLTTAVNGKATLRAEVQPTGAPGAVRWSSSAPSIVSVAGDGSITARAEGEAVITATSVFAPSVTSSVTVNVVPPGLEAAKADLRAAVSAVNQTTTDNLALAVKGPIFGSDITWASSNAGIITPTTAQTANGPATADPYGGGGIVTRPAYGTGDVTASVTATVTLNGFTVTSDPIPVAVKEKTRTAPNAAYASVNFKTENGRDLEQIWVSSTEGNDFFSFRTRNGGQPVIVSDADTKGLRDPYVLRSHDGDKYYMVATDLDTSSGNWDGFQTNGSIKLEVYESPDMVNWTRTNGDGDGGITVNTPTAGMSWAPEAFWDDALQSYVVFFSSRIYQDETRTNPVRGKYNDSYNQVMAVITRDFRTFSYPPIAWQNTGYSRIDSSVFQIGDYYYRLTKNEEGRSAGQYLPAGKMTFLERSKVLTSPTTVTSPANDPERTWQLVDESLLPFEGAASVKLNAGDPNNNADQDALVLLADEFSYIPFMTSEKQVLASSWSNRLSQTPGWFDTKQPGPGVTGRVSTDGMPEITRHGAFLGIPQAVSTALENWTGIAAVGSQTDATYTAATRVLRVAVTAQDKGTLAGSVTLAGGEWTQTVRLAADGTASVIVPDQVSGTVSVAYDGYTDGLVAASRDEVTGIRAAEGSSVLPMDATASTRKIAGKTYVIVTATNRSTVPVRVDVVTEYGKKTFVTVKPNQTVSATVNSRRTTIPAGTATVSATATIDGKQVTSRVDAAYGARK
ncbi:immunoglobulin-like domain-containing protein [Microbacterium testaceum]|uniref:immunoglobulin-like domain-containing protein n=1 Tax=Microbacterium testaceum TaxID=2033 RepID=UPI00187CC140|nr:immunoglobulin-like domain-containing protein [Microbacterium testaceum]